MRAASTSDSQVHGHLFVLRRMENALVRRDTRMLRDPASRHRRALQAGVGLAMLGLLAALVIGVIHPVPALPDEGIVIAKRNGAVYVVTKDPATLTPTFNLASAKLLVAALGGAPGAPAVVDESVLRATGLRTGRRTGIPDAPELLPVGDQALDRRRSTWAVCDDTSDGLRTTVLAGLVDDERAPDGERPPGERLRPDEALLVRAGGRDHLVYRPSDDRNGRAVVRAELDPVLRSAWNLHAARPREVSTAVLNAIPRVDLPRPPTGPLTRGRDVSGATGYRLGATTVPESVARLVWHTGAAVVDGDIRQGTTQPWTGDYPRTTPRLPDEKPVLCATWSPRTDVRGALWESTSVRLAPALNDDAVRIAVPGPRAERVDAFRMPTGRAAFVRGAVSRETHPAGPLFLVTDRGTTYRVPDERTARVLGMDHDPLPAPDALLRLLPSGPQLDQQAARRTYDGLTPASPTPAVPARGPR